MISSLDEKQVRSSFDSKEIGHEVETFSDSKFDEVDEETSHFSDEVVLSKRVTQKFQFEIWDLFRSNDVGET